MAELFRFDEPWLVAAGVFLLGVLIAAAVGVLVLFVARRVLREQARASRYALLSVWAVLAVAAAVALASLLGPETTEVGLAVAGTRLFRALPDVLIALLLLVLGAIVATGLRSLLRTVLSRIGPAAADIVAPLGYWMVVGLAILLAADQLGVETDLVQWLVLLVVAGLALASALAFGLGAQDLVAEVIAGRHVAQIIAVGDEIEVDGLRGRVVALGHASVRLAVGEREAEVPNGTFLEATVVVRQRGPRAPTLPPEAAGSAGPGPQ
ncbi:MAG: mechanosensitive ion channel, partial [Actinomycetota bacterium]|nr:mechanosensitive ion channel [Actinomycetota bacterium]